MGMSNRAPLRALARAIALLVVMGGGCTFTATHIEPRPWIEGSRVPQPFKVQLVDEIPEDLLLFPEDGLPQLDIKGWRTALTRGFELGVPQRFPPAKDDEPAWMLLIESAEPKLYPIDFDDTGAVVLFGALITYKARLFDEQAREVEVLEGRVHQQQTFRGVSDGSPLLADAIEQLVLELIQRSASIAARARELAPPAPPAEAPPDAAPPG